MPAAQDSPTDSAFDVLAVGNALVDVLAPVDDDLVAELGQVKGMASLVDLSEAERLYAAAQPIVEVAGGAAANTAVGAASLGSRAAFVGKVADDRLGRLFETDIKAAGVDYETCIAADGVMTGRCLSLVSPDAERTMSTYLGAAAQLRAEDIDDAAVGRARVTHLEAYLWDLADAERMLGRVMADAHGSGGMVSVSLSDPSCVQRHADSFRRLVRGEIDVLFANEDEITLLLDVDDVTAAAEVVRSLDIIAALTLGPNGSLVVSRDETVRVDAHPVDKVVDVTGAGDFYAAGFLHGLTHGADLRTCGRLGSLAAGEIISHLGARPEVPLRPLAQEAGLLH
ncbi:MAG TPA: adenosine kinase [Acidimicrobiales bacterium]|nr:adenosine kinase [Acidimicrobiales bacterium]